MNGKIISLMLFLWLIEGQLLSLELQKTEATLYANDELVLKFVSTGGEGRHTFRFLSLPVGWTANQNRVIIPDFQVGRDKIWNFDVYVVDQSSTYLRQTVKARVEGYQVEVLPVTLPKIGNYRTGEQFKQPTVQKYNFTELIDQYPGSLQAQQFQAQYGVQYDPSLSLTPQIIGKTPVSFNPSLTDAELTKAQAEIKSAYEAKMVAEKAIANMLHIIKQLKQKINKAQRQIQAQKQKKKNNERSLEQCTRELSNADDKKRKITSAIKDKKTKIDQYNLQIQYTEELAKEIDGEVGNLKKQRVAIEKFYTPESQNLEKLENQFAMCQSNINQGMEETFQFVVKANQNNAEIDITRLEMSQSRQTLNLLATDLLFIDSQIAELKNRLAQAESEQKKISEKERYYRVLPFEGQVKIKVLQQQNFQYINNIQASTNNTKNQQNQCENIKQQIFKVRQSLNENRFNYDKINNQIKAKEQELSSKKAQIDDFQQNLDELPIQLSTLQNQLSKQEQIIETQQFICQSAEKQLAELEKSLQRNDKILLDDREFLKNAEVGLKTAREDQSKADKLIEVVTQKYQTSSESEIIKVTSSPLAFFSNYRSQVRSSDTENYGIEVITDTIDQAQLQKNEESNNTRKKNNPPQKTSDSESRSLLDGSFKIGSKLDKLQPILINSLKQMVRSVFKLQIGDEFEDKKYLYPLNPTQKNQVIRLSTITFFNCHEGNTFSSIGTLLSLQLGSLIVDVQGKRHSLSLSQCTLIASTEEGNFFTPGSKVILYGVSLYNLLGTTLVNVYRVIIIP